MYDTCPKCQYQRRADDQSDPDICPACGIIFSKWLKSQLGGSSSRRTVTKASANNSAALLPLLASWLLPEEKETNPVIFWSRVALYVGLFMKCDQSTTLFPADASYVLSATLIFYAVFDLSSMFLCVANFINRLLSDELCGFSACFDLLV